MLALNVEAFKYAAVMTDAEALLYQPTNLWTANSTAINAIVIHPESSVSASMLTNSGATLDGVQIYTSGFTNGAWRYALDFQRTNATGQILMYQSILATNSVRMDFTNMRRWSLLSVNIVASGTNVLVVFPSPVPHLYTNGLTPFITNGLTNYSLWLTNGNEFRGTFQSNAVGISTLWATFGQ